MTHHEYMTLLEKRVPEFTFTDNNDVVVTRLGLSITLYWRVSAVFERSLALTYAFMTMNLTG